MTVKEFWHLKYGTIIGRDRGFKGKVVKREVIDEICGFVVSKTNEKLLTTGRRILEITLDCGNGQYRYVQSNINLTNFRIYPQETKLESW